MTKVIKGIAKCMSLSAIIAVSAFAETPAPEASLAAKRTNLENPLYAPGQFEFYSKTAFGWMYKKSDDNLAMQAKGWVNRTENPVLRFYEDFGFGITDWLAIRGIFGYTHAPTKTPDADRSGMHQGRLGLNFRVLNGKALNGLVWDVYSDAFLGGIQPMKAELVASNNPLVVDGVPTYPLSFNYENYGNGRWGVWFGTMVGSTFDKFTISAFAEFQRTFGNDNSEIKIGNNAKPVIEGMVAQGAIPGICEKQGISAAACNKMALGPVYDAIEDGAKQVAALYVDGLPKDFSVDTKGTWEWVTGFKTLYELNSNWAIGGGIYWRHRATNTVDGLNIKNSSVLDADKEVSDGLVADITDGIANQLAGSMEDGIDEYTFTLLCARNLTNNLQLTLYGEYQFDSAEEKSQLSTERKAELGLRFNAQF